MFNSTIKKSVSKASKVVGNTWPLYSFVTSNQLSGYEEMPFKTALEYASRYLGAKVYPDFSTFRSAWKHKEINENILKSLLVENGFNEDPKHYLDLLSKLKPSKSINKNTELDRIVSKWLGAFLDEGLAGWSMPNKSSGFFKAWKTLAKYDGKTKKIFEQDIPDTSEETLGMLLSSHTENEITSIFTQHLAALPGWVGYIKHRNEANTQWQQEFPIDLIDYLAVRLLIAKSLNMPLNDDFWEMDNLNESLEIQHLFLKAWETTWQKKITHQIQTEANKMGIEQSVPVDAQMVFCIDTRSELIRRHIESIGNYETYGYAGFFGIATDYQDFDTGISRKSCPPIVPSAYLTQEIPNAKITKELTDYRKKSHLKKFKNYLLKRLKNMLPSAFGYVEGTGAFYGLFMLKRTLLPGKPNYLPFQKSCNVERLCETEVSGIHDHNHQGIALSEKVGIVKSAFDLLGWSNFARLVIFVGHGSHSTNNPFASSLDCGACAASPGRHNARLLAKLANEPEVRSLLNQHYKIHIPESTIFVGAEHNTTTDEIILFDSHLKDQYLQEINDLKFHLEKARNNATNERLSLKSNGIKQALQKSLNWSETRPEWGLAKNAGFVIGSRQLTRNLNMEGKCFLHSYDWRKDMEGTALESIMQGPMVVTQWINNHYYLSTVDNKNLGGGDKISHNVIGKFGVVQGNGGDLKFGLPLQSVKSSDDVNYHDPLRLSVMIHAPVERVSLILLKNQHLKNLLDNQWIYLLVINPEDANTVVKYNGNLNWIEIESNPPLKQIANPKENKSNELEATYVRV